MQPAMRSMCLSVLQCGPSGPLVCVFVYVCLCVLSGCRLFVCFKVNTHPSVKLLYNAVFQLLIDLLIWYHLPLPTYKCSLDLARLHADRHKIGHHVSPLTTQHSTISMHHLSPLLLNYNHSGWRRWLYANLWRLGISLDQREMACSMVGGE